MSDEDKERSDHEYRAPTTTTPTPAGANKKSNSNNPEDSVKVPGDPKERLPEKTEPDRKRFRLTANANTAWYNPDGDELLETSYEERPRQNQYGTGSPRDNDDDEVSNPLAASGRYLPARRNLRRAHYPTSEEIEFFEKFTVMRKVKELTRVNDGLVEAPIRKLKFKNLENLPTNKTLNQNVGRLMDIYIRTVLQKAKGDFTKTRYWLGLRHSAYKEREGFFINHKTYAMVDGHTLVNNLARHMQSNKNLDLDEAFEIDMQVFENSLPEKSQSSLQNYLGKGKNGQGGDPLGQQVTKKFGVQHGVVDGNTHCMLKAFAIGKAWCDYNKEEKEDDKNKLFYKYKSLIRERGKLGGREQKQLKEAKKILAEAEMDPEKTEHGLEDLMKLADYYKEYIIRLYLRDGNTVVPKLDNEFNKDGSKGTISLYLEDGHYEFYKPVATDFHVKYCPQCQKLVEEDHRKTCSALCRRCGGYGCGGSRDAGGTEFIHCEKCNINFYSESCYSAHIEKPNPQSLPFCAKYAKCRECFQIHSRPEYKKRKHHCYATNHCKICGEYIRKNHTCCHKIPTMQEQRAMEKKEESWVMVVYDFECIVSRSGDDDDDEKSLEKVTHEPNLVSFRLICNDCYDGKWALESKCPHCRSVYSFSYKDCPAESTVTQKFAKFLLTDSRLKKAYVIAHNGGRYDHAFLLTTLTEMTKKEPLLIANGNTIINAILEVSKERTLTFRDSVKFLPMRLSAMPAAFGLKEEAKGHFPYKLNHPSNYGRVWSSLPSIKNYDPDYMSEKDKILLEKWHEENKNTPFDFDKEILRYCESDVQILTLAVCQYMKNCEAMFKKWNPIIQCCTLAGYVMHVMKTMHIKENVLGFIPETGFTGRNNSQLALKYIRWLEFKNPSLDLQHSLRGQEKELKAGENRYYVDAFDTKTKEVYEVNGCLWHGCPKCYPDRDAFCPRNKDTSFGTLYERTMKRQKDIEEAGYKVHVIWECEITQQLRKKREMSRFFKNCRSHTQLQPRQAMYGGRTQGFKALVEAGENQTIEYYDYCSLYPWVNMKGTEYPKGQPIRITDNFDMSDRLKYKGIIFCDVLPPNNLELPVLPYRINEKLVFPLCRLCAENMEQKKCTHKKASERCLTGVWCSDELNLAIKEGYRILRFHEVWHWPEKEWFVGGFFSDFLKPLLKMKHEASGWPRADMTDEEKMVHVETIEKNDGVRIDAEKVEKNPALRSLTKLFLNSAWGKFAQNPQKTEIKFIPNNDIVSMANFFNESGYEPKIFKHWGTTHWMCARRVVGSAVQTIKFTNVVYGALTTSAARIRLYKAMKKIGADRLIYCDTDSVIFIQEKGTDILRDLKGDGLGMLTREVPEDVAITKFVTAASKVYAMEMLNIETGKVSHSIKAKGVTLNTETVKSVNFKSMKKMMEKYVATKEINPLTSVRVAFKREELLGPIHSTYEEKQLQPVTNKGRFSDNGNFEPYGLASPEREIEQDIEY